MSLPADLIRELFYRVKAGTFACLSRLNKRYAQIALGVNEIMKDLLTIELQWSSSYGLTLTRFLPNHEVHGAEEFLGHDRYRYRVWQHNKLNGPEEIFSYDDNKNMNLIMRIEWRENQKHGLEAEYENNCLIMQRYWDSGMLNGLEERFHQDNSGDIRLIYRCEWLYGKKHGHEEEWDSAGVKTKSQKWEYGKRVDVDEDDKGDIEEEDTETESSEDSGPEAIVENESKELSEDGSLE